MTQLTWPGFNAGIGTRLNDTSSITTKKENLSSYKFYSKKVRVKQGGPSPKVKNST